MALIIKKNKLVVTIQLGDQVTNNLLVMCATSKGADLSIDGDDVVLLLVENQPDLEAIAARQAQFRLEWKDAMEWYQGQPQGFKNNIRSVAISEFVTPSYGEGVGSSDINHGIFQLYKDFKDNGNNDLLTYLVERKGGFNE